MHFEDLTNRPGEKSGWKPFEQPILEDNNLHFSCISPGYQRTCDNRHICGPKGTTNRETVGNGSSPKRIVIRNKRSLWRVPICKSCRSIYCECHMRNNWPCPKAWITDWESGCITFHSICHLAAPFQSINAKNIPRAKTTKTRDHRATLFGTVLCSHSIKVPKTTSNAHAPYDLPDRDNGPLSFESRHPELYTAYEGDQA